MSAVLIDSNVILDAIFESSPWSAWSHGTSKLSRVRSGW